jgi:hypothetical protein
MLTTVTCQSGAVERSRSYTSVVPGSNHDQTRATLIHSVGSPAQILNQPIAAAGRELKRALGHNCTWQPADCARQA